MKKIIIIFTLLFFASIELTAQTDGLSYQAVILNPKSRELPGVNSSGNIFPNKSLSVRFTILNSVGEIDFQEVHNTKTDAYGLINLIIGQGSPILGSWKKIFWNGTSKDLKVEIKLDDVYLELSKQPLLYVPYAHYRDLIATGDLTVSGKVSFFGDLKVDGDTNLNTLTVDGATNLKSTLNVDGATTINNSLTVLGKTDLQDDLVVNGTTDLNKRLWVNNGSPTKLTGTLDVDGITNLNKAFNVNNSSPTKLTGTLNVDGVTNINNTFNVNNSSPTKLTGTLDVDGVTNLNNAFNVNNSSPTKLTGTLDVDGAATINNNLTVSGNTALKGDLVVDGTTDLNKRLWVNNSSPTKLTGTLDVDGATTINNISNLYGQVTINAAVTGGDTDYNAYPLRVQGSDQGIAIKLNPATPNTDNNFITFFNGGGNAVGRIEGQTAGDVASDPQYIFDLATMTAETVAAGVNVGLSALPVVSGGLIVTTGVCAGCIAIAAADLVLATANLAAFNAFAFSNLGVTYQSGSADYAEWLERVNPNEKIAAGDIVGVNGGKISKYTSNAQQYMVISTKPAILGNMPMTGKEYLYEKVAFLGQIPVKVRGIVMSGDYILPSGLADGTGIAISPNDIKPEQYKEIVGIAWSASIMNNGISIINMAIGLNNNDVANLAVRQEKKITDLESKFNSLEKRLLSLENGSANTQKEEKEKEVLSKKELVSKKEMSRTEMMISSMPAEISDKDIEDAMLLIKNTYTNKGIKIEEYPGLNKLFVDANYKAEIIKNVKENYKMTYKSILESTKK